MEGSDGGACVCEAAGAEGDGGAGWKGSSECGVLSRVGGARISHVLESEGGAAHLLILLPSG